MISLEKLRQLASQNEKQNKAIAKKLRTKKPKDLDKFVANLHDSIFKKIDCLDCAYCCKTLGPRVTDTDIKRISKFLRIKEEQFINQYLKVDEDKDFVFKEMPCPFLMEDNYCFIYEARPKACKEYPHTDRKKFHQILNLSVKNTFTCPVVFEVFEELKKKY